MAREYPTLDLRIIVRTGRGVRNQSCSNEKAQMTLPTASVISLLPVQTASFTSAWIAARERRVVLIDHLYLIRQRHPRLAFGHERPNPDDIALKDRFVTDKIAHQQTNYLPSHHPPRPEPINPPAARIASQTPRAIRQ